MKKAEIKKNPYGIYVLQCCFTCENYDPIGKCKVGNTLFQFALRLKQVCAAYKPNGTFLNAGKAYE